jgi:hypothetical protein
MTGTVIVQKCALLPVSAMAMDSVRVAEGGPTVLGSHQKKAKPRLVIFLVIFYTSSRSGMSILVFVYTFLLLFTHK